MEEQRNANRRRTLRLAALAFLTLSAAFAYADFRYGLVASFDPHRPIASVVECFTRGWTNPTGAVVSDTLAPTSPGVELSLEAKLFHTILIGKAHFEGLYDPKLLSDPALPERTRELVAAAVATMQQPPCCAIQSSLDYLESRLRSAERIERVALAEDIPPLNNDDLILLHVYALVLGGQSERAIATLSASFGRDSVFAQSVAAVALRAIGSKAAMSALRTATIESEKVRTIAEEAAGIERPNLAEPKHYESEMPFAERTREKMLVQASNDRNGTRTIQPTLLLGYLGEDAPPEVRGAELQYLRSTAGRDVQTMWYRSWYGTVSLSLRSRETYRYWKERLLTERAPYTQMGLMRILAQRYPTEFLRDAPEFAGSSLVAWGRSDAIVMAATIARGDQPLGSLDLIWFHPKRYRMEYPAFPGSLPKSSADGIVERFAKGNFTPDPSCAGCMLSWFSYVRRPENDRHFVLGLIRGRAAGSAYTSAADRFEDLRVLPALSALAKSYPEESEPRRDIERAIEVSRDGDGEGKGVCCNADEACLVSQARLATLSAIEEMSIESAIAYLEALPAIPSVKVTPIAGAERSASVAIGGGPARRWAHWLGCWRPESVEK